MYPQITVSHFSAPHCVVRDLKKITGLLRYHLFMLKYTDGLNSNFQNVLKESYVLTVECISHLLLAYLQCPCGNKWFHCVALMPMR